VVDLRARQIAAEPCLEAVSTIIFALSRQVTAWCANAIVKLKGIAPGRAGSTVTTIHSTPGVITCSIANPVSKHLRSTAVHQACVLTRTALELEQRLVALINASILVERNRIRTVISLWTVSGVPLACLIIASSVTHAVT